MGMTAEGTREPCTLSALPEVYCGWAFMPCTVSSLLMMGVIG